MQYTTINIKHIDIARLNEDAYRLRIEQAFNDAIRVNREAHAAAFAKWKQIRIAVTDLYGAGSTQEKYILKQPVPEPPDLQKIFKKLLKQAADWKLEQVRKSKARASYRSHKERREQAVIQLESMGYQSGYDFGPGRAITFLKKVQREKATIESEQAPEAI